ncbi:5-oxoprolinase subunit PxpB [Terrihabitans soli]|nr:5-oxoprolinase subunit PxpB [Terrihabitans soli]
MLALGDAAVTLEFGQTIGRETSARVLAARDAIVAAAIPGVREYVPTFRSLTVHYDPAAIGFADLAARIGDLSLEGAASAGEGRTWTVPVLYDGPDLDETARAAGLTREAAAALHAGQTYHVYMLGFLPGFAYLGDLPEPLRLPRLDVPRTRVPAGSVAIASELTAIYPVESPGGWRLIGRTPLRLFDHRAHPPSLFAPGDRVQFTPVSAAEFDQLVRGAKST